MTRRKAKQICAGWGGGRFLSPAAGNLPVHMPVQTQDV